MSHISETFVDLLAQGFSSLPRWDEPFFSKLWREGRLQYCDKVISPDQIDELSARLVCAALHQRQQLLIVLPDRAPHRPAMLFASGLIMHALDQLKSSRPGGKVLYFGSRVGIRDQLSQVRVDTLKLDSVFNQVRTMRDINRTEAIRPQGTVQLNAPLSFHLPEVVTVYSPADPTAVIDKYYADWIAVDCGDQGTLHWLLPLLEYAHIRGIPIVGWGQNAFSQSLRDFTQSGCNVFRWPRMLLSNKDDKSFLTRPPEHVYEDNSITHIIPFFVGEAETDSANVHLCKAYQTLARLSHDRQDRLGRDALRVGWNYFRALETLVIPFDLYEAEAHQFWGLETITRSRDAFERFIEAARPSSSNLCAGLEEAAGFLDKAQKILHSNEPPLWKALTQLCVEESSDDAARLLVFPSAARRQLFSFALSAYYNLTEEDLKQLRIGLINLKELAQEIVSREIDNEYQSEVVIWEELNPYSAWSPLLVGLPSPFLSPFVEPMLRARKVEFLLYPYQASSLKRRIGEWNAYLKPNLPESVKTLRELGSKQESILDYKDHDFLFIESSRTIELDNQRARASIADSLSLWNLNDPLDEVAWLLTTSDEAEEAPIVLETSDQNVEDASASNTEPIVVEQAIEVCFEGGWQALFPLDATINIIYTTPMGQRVAERYVRSLRSGDRVIFIHGQKRQSLYDLIISRVHGKPSIQIHLILIRRWQNELQSVYERRRRTDGLTAETLLKQLQAQGSKLTSPQTVRLWLCQRTICPDDPEDLRRLAEILDLPFVQRYYKQIHNAAQRLSGLHIKFALLLNNWLKRNLTTTITAAETLDELIDKELGITFRDFQDSLMILKVKTTLRQEGPFPRQGLGLLDKGDR